MFQLSGIQPSIVSTRLVIIGISVIYSLVLEWRVALCILGFMPLVIITSILYMKMIVGNGTDQGDHIGQASTSMDALSNIRTVMSLTAERYFLEKFNHQFENEKKIELKKGIASGPLLSFPMSAIIFMGAITFAIGGHLMDKGETTFTDIMRIYILIMFGGSAIGRSSSAVPDADKAMEAAVKVKNVLDVKQTIDCEDDNGNSLAVMELQKPGYKPPVWNGKIEFRNVSFCYPTRPGVKVLKNVSFTVEAGQRVAFCGVSGGGKSTIMQLVQRLYDPDSGQVLFDGIDVKTTNVRAHRANLGLVAQEPVLFAMTVKENIQYGSKEANMPASDDEVYSACKQANVTEFIERLEQGLDTQVGERGGKMSGGQKQRIAIARYEGPIYLFFFIQILNRYYVYYRAIIRKPAIVLLDEATSALDTASERIVQEALDTAASGRTSLAIAHRLSTIQNSDKILVLAHGNVAEEGKHGELMAKKGIYYDLQMAQQQQKVTAKDSN